ncbi:glycosyltransferase family 2 protein [Spirochaeta dissipatitropha]
MSWLQLDVSRALQLVAAFFALNLLLILSLCFRRFFRRRRQAVYQKAEQGLLRSVSMDEDARARLLRRLPRRVLLLSFLRISQRVQLSPGFHSSVARVLKQKRVLAYLRRMFSSPSAYHRRYAILCSRVLPEPIRVKLLLQGIRSEKQAGLRIRIAAQLLVLSDPQVLGQYGPAIVSAIHKGFMSAPEVYRRRIIAMLQPHAQLLAAWVQQHGKPLDTWAARMTVAGLPALPEAMAEEFLLHLVHFDDSALLKSVSGLVYQHFRYLFDRDVFRRHASIEIRSAIASSRAEKISFEHSHEWLPLLGDPAVSEAPLQVLQGRLTSSKLPLVMDVYKKIMDKDQPDLQRALARLIEPLLVYLLQKTFDRQALPADPVISQLLHDLLDQNRNMALIQFLISKHRDADIAAWQATISSLRSEFPGFDQDCRAYLPDAVQKQLGMDGDAAVYEKPKIPLQIGDRLLLVLLAAAVISLGPVLYFLLPVSGRGLADFSLFYQAMFVFYSLSVNLSYSLLLVLSALHVYRRRGSLDELELLFTPGVLPSVSVIAPAYNEEKNIVDSVRSLLSLRYPAFDVVVVNDGSSDATLQRVKDAFNMTMTDVPRNPLITTAPIWAVYRSKDVPNLVLVDKANGGKADSLNAGIGICSGEYFCGIDADSMLEQDALLGLMAAILDSDRETAAIGGNVLPINGSRVRNGYIEKFGISGKPLALFQTIEYLRAFIAGRMGWAETGSLLIISGAFGAFRRDRVLEIGGYLTGTGRYRKDTVGEDMELVVRLRRHLFKRKVPHRVEYQHKANCWTEVPEDRKSLLKQRDRWNRGLIEILLFHRRLFMNPRYRNVGMLAVPYFFIFEMLGPFLETLGYAAVIVSLIFGFFNPVILLALFAVSICYGIVISTSALLMADGAVISFRKRELALLLLFTIIENFGYRQIIAVQRAWSYIAYLFRNPGWQKMERKGFSA